MARAILIFALGCWAFVMVMRINMPWRDRAEQNQDPKATAEQLQLILKTRAKVLTEQDFPDVER